MLYNRLICIARNQSLFPDEYFGLQSIHKLYVSFKICNLTVHDISNKTSSTLNTYVLLISRSLFLMIYVA